MIKASDIGLTKQDLDILEECGKVRKQFIDEVLAETDARAFEKLNIPRQHSLLELIGLMQYKRENIKAKVIPTIFAEVVSCLEELQKYRQKEIAEKIYTEEDL